MELRYSPWCQVQHILERGNSVSCHLANVCLLAQRLVKDVCCLLLFRVLIDLSILAVLSTSLDVRHAWNVKAHLDKLIAHAARLLAATSRTAQVTICASLFAVAW